MSDDHEYYSQIYTNLDEDNVSQEFVNVEINNKNSDEILIDAVRQYLHLYDSSLRDYKDVQIKDMSLF